MEEQKPIVLYIDDEPNNLNVFKATFRKEYSVLLAQSPAEGKQILQQQTVHVILADQRMPGMTGIEFFESILEKYPDPIRILLTGYADIEAVIRAINYGQVFRYIKKPWDDHELSVAISNAYQLYMAREQLTTTTKSLKKSNEELNRFVYSASHDLRAPLKSILGIVNVAEMESANSPTEHYLSMIKHSVKKLDNFINNIVNYYKNERLTEQLHPIDFEYLIRDAFESIQFYNEFAGVDVRIEVTQQEVFIHDEFRIRVILNNLLSNSVKYQKPTEPNKYVAIRVEIKNGTASLVIEDNGIGINTKHIQNIYNMFYRATNESSGSGIGLYLVKDAVDKMGGEIFVDSTEGHGTKFRIVIPNKANLVKVEEVPSI